MQACRVLNATYEELPQNIAPEDALIHILAGRAVLEMAHPVKRFRTVTEIYPYPIAIRLTNYVKIKPKYSNRVKLSKYNLYVRDNYTCQYCNRHVSQFNKKERLTKDHVIPRDNGGESTWENLVTACSTCNHRKANRNPDEAKMRLLRLPFRPTKASLDAKRKKFKLTLEWEE